MKIGFIGQGFIGKNYADDFEARGHSVVRYALEEPFRKNEKLISKCDIVFIAVPTPTTPEGFSAKIVEKVLGLVGAGKTAVIKSTIIPGTTERLAKKYPEIFVMHSPEFLREKTAAYDAAHPDRNIIGIPKDTPEFRKRAEDVLKVLPNAPYNKIIDARTAEFVKYVGNCFLFNKVIFLNIMFNLASKLELDWGTLKEAVTADPRIGTSHTDVLHQSGHGGKPGRGAGGHCFIKDFAAMRELYEKLLPNEKDGISVLNSLEKMNVNLLKNSEKDIDLLEEVYGSLK